MLSIQLGILAKDSRNDYDYAFCSESKFIKKPKIPKAIRTLEKSIYLKNNPINYNFYPPNSLHNPLFPSQTPDPSPNRNPILQFLPVSILYIYPIISTPEMQVIHRFNGIYPFSLDSQSQHTYLQLVKQNLTQQQIAQYRTKYKLIKILDHTHLIKLMKIYKEQNSLHLLYEYYPYSIEHYLQYLCENTQKKDKHVVKFANAAFLQNLERIIDVLVQSQIQTDIFIQNFAIEELTSFHLKLFMDPQSQFLQLLQQNQHDQDIIEANCNKNKEILREFYNAEKQRLLIQFQEVMEKYFGKSVEVSQSNRPNFVINGSKLVFIGGGQQKNIEKEHKNSINSQISNKNATKKKQLSRSPAKFQRPQAKQNLKQKNLKKIEQIKSVLTKLQHKTYNSNPEPHNPFHQPKSPQQDIDFRPEQIQTDKTAILQQNEYLQCLQNQLAKMNGTKKQRQSLQKRNDILKQIDKIQQKSKDSFHYNDKGDEKKGHRVESNMSTQATNKSQDRGIKKDRFNNSDEIGIKTQEKKANKYKMKITTSHQIEIEGRGEPEIRQAEHQILQGIKNGRINLPSFSQRPKTVKIQTQQMQKPPKESTKPTSITQDLRMNSRNSDIASKSKKINEIIQKIQSRANINQQMSNSSHQNQNKNDSHQTHNPIKPNNTDHQHFSQNYLDKIRQAKQKAQHALKQYAKKKQ